MCDHQYEEKVDVDDDVEYDGAPPRRSEMMDEGMPPLGLSIGGDGVRISWLLIPYYVTNAAIDFLNTDNNEWLVK